MQRQHLNSCTFKRGKCDLKVKPRKALQGYEVEQLQGYTVNKVTTLQSYKGAS